MRDVQVFLTPEGSQPVAPESQCTTTTPEGSQRVFRVRDSSGKPGAPSSARGLAADSPTALHLNAGTPKQRVLGVALVSILLCSFVPAFAQQEAPIKIVDRIFNSYISNTDDTDSQDDKTAMQQALTALQTSAQTADLPLLINVWMYYDVTDFPTQELIEPIFEKDPTATLSAINERVKRMKKWESVDTAPFSDLPALRDRFTKDTKR